MAEIPVLTVEQAWVNLASNVLRLAIEDARTARNPRKRNKARAWLLSRGARLLFESVLPETADLDINAWVLAGCPVLGENE